MTDTKYISVTTIPSLDRITLRDAHKAFAAYKQRGVIIDCNYDDDSWAIDDERTVCHIDFRIENNGFAKHFGYLRISSNEMVDYLKAYVLCMIGDLISHTIQTITREIRLVISHGIPDGSDGHVYTQMIHVHEFFTLLPVGDGIDSGQLDYMHRALTDSEDYYARKAHGNQRQLASFESYFKFNDLLNRFWHSASQEQKLFYFPVYLWWQLSAIIPMRPTEFVMTPRKCLVENDGQYSIKIRKTKLKGGKTKVAYRIAEDYETVAYGIRHDLAEEIKWYIQCTDAIERNSYDTLFCRDTHYSQWDRGIPINTRYYSYVNLTTCLRYFFSEIIEGLYGYTVIRDRYTDYLQDNEINYLYIGDTRHLAMVSMISQGATPMVAMVLAGHADIDISSHYYSNITRYIECQTYRQYKALTRGQEHYEISGHTSLPALKPYTLIGPSERCYSERYAQGIYDDCAYVAGPNGEIGYCPECRYYYADHCGIHDTAERCKSQIANEWELLRTAVDKYRRFKGGDRGDIVQAIQNLRSAEYTYQEYLRETMTERGECYAEDQKDIYGRFTADG